MSAALKKLEDAILDKECLETQIEQHKRELDKEKSFSESIFETLSDAILLTDDEGVIVKANAKFRDFVYHNEVIGKNISDFIFNKDLVSLKISKLQKAKEKSCVFSYDGESREIISSWRQIFNQKDEMLNMFMFKDVTEFNKQLRSYANFAQLSPFPVFSICPDGSVITSNLIAIELFEIFNDFNWFDISIDLDAEKARKIIKHSMIHIEEIEHNEKHFYIQYRGIKGDDYINVYCFDVTEQKQSEQKIKELQDELIDEAYNQGIAENSVHVLHNIGNVLTTMIGKGDFTKKELQKKTTTTLYSKVISKLETMSLEDLDEKAFLALKRTLKTLEGQFLEDEQRKIDSNDFTLKEALRISEIISTQQKYANLKTKVNSIIKVEDLVNDLVTMHKYRIDKREINLVMDICPRTEVNVEKVGLSQTISNAIVNAIESIDEKAKSEHRENTWQLEITTIKKNGFIALVVADNGMGIKKENVEKLFNYGFSTKERGSGFGLHNCANYMQTIGGSIEIISDGEFLGAQTVIKVPVYKKVDALSEVS